ncbi:MAG TPA: glycosyltransferase [Paracoccaceae bacterium]|nr:glycosyltransferase [Paracoccaceae bacterium]
MRLGPGQLPDPQPAGLPAEGRARRILLIVHQFFPQFHHGTETISERTARALAAMGYGVDIVTSVLVDRKFLSGILESPLCPPEARALLTQPEVPLAQGFTYPYAEGIRVHAFTHSHDPKHGIPRFRREVAEPAIEVLVASLLAAGRYERAIVFHQLHIPDRALRLIRRRGVPISFVATDFFAVCPIGSQQFEDGRPCAGPGPASLHCVRHLSDQRGWLKWLQDGLPTRLTALGLILYRWLGPWPRLRVHPYQNLWYLLERNHRARHFLRGCDLLVAPSSRIERSLVAAGASRHRLRREAYGMPAPTARPARAHLSDPEIRLCFAGVINERKGLHVLLDALGRLPADLPPWRLDIWGDFGHGADYAARERERAVAFGARVRLAGTFPSYEVHAVLGRYDYLVIPSTWAENLPLILLSALQIGLPVIISDAEGLMDAFPDGRVFGRSFRMGDAGDLARILAEEIRARPLYDPAAAPRVPTVEEFAATLLGRG